ncbi:MAG: hypothetical protein PHC38_11275 [Weeksellaceae bacterium]|nr:hypothetical protein [Weeksellaceae bacterium]
MDDDQRRQLATGEIEIKTIDGFNNLDEYGDIPEDFVEIYRAWAMAMKEKIVGCESQESCITCCYNKTTSQYKIECLKPLFYYFTGKVPTDTHHGSEVFDAEVQSTDRTGNIPIITSGAVAMKKYASVITEGSNDGAKLFQQIYKLSRIDSIKIIIIAAIPNNALRTTIRDCLIRNEKLFLFLDEKTLMKMLYLRSKKDYEYSIENLTNTIINFIEKIQQRSK